MQSRIQRSLLRAALVAVGVLVAAGCGDVSLNQTDAGPDDAARQEDGAPPRDAALTLTLRVLVGPDKASQTPGAGATVALEGAAGVIGEKTADANGRVTFTGIEFEKGAVSATAHLEGYPLYSRVGITETAAEVLLWIQIPRYFGTELVEVSGQLPATTSLYWYEVSSSTSGYLISGEQFPATVEFGNWSMRIPADVPFTIFSHLQAARSASTPHRESDEPVLAWVAQAHAGITEATTIDLDFSRPLPVKQRFTSSMSLKHLRALSPLRTGGHTLIHLYGSCSPFWAGHMGSATKTWLRADETAFDYEFEWVEPPGVDQFCMTYILCEPGPPAPRAQANCAFVRVPGLPDGAAVTPEFLDLPILLSGQDRDVMPVHSAIEWAAFDPEATVQLFLTSASGAPPVWTIEAPSSLTTMAIPRPPSTVDLRASLGQELVWVTLGVVDFDALGYQKRDTSNAPFAMTL